MAIEPKKRKSDDGQAPTSRIESFSNATMPFLWFVFAVTGFALLYPLAKDTVTRGLIDSLKVGIIEVHLRTVPETLVDVTAPQSLNRSEERPDELNPAPAVFKPIGEERRKALAARLSRLKSYTNGAAILWVDDNNPYQNISERRVLTDANIKVDLARTTDEALEWLKRAQYDVVITDLNRESIRDLSARCRIKGAFCQLASDPGDVCSGDKSEKPQAGCRLLNRIGVCFKEEPATTNECDWLRWAQNRQTPSLIVYAAHYNLALGMPYQARATNQATELYILDALEARSSKVFRDKEEPLPS
jgi:CheY-like chemotaxis protein